MARTGGLKGDSRLLSGFRTPNLPAFTWRATGDISAEVFSMNKPSARRSLVETATPFKDKPHDDDDDDDDDDVTVRQMA